MSLVDVQSAPKYQQKLLNVACTLLKPGGMGLYVRRNDPIFTFFLGTLVYSTCTINPEENEGNVRYVLDSLPELSLVKQQSPYLGEMGLDAFGLSLSQR